MAYRPDYRTLADLRNLARTLDLNRRAYDPVSWAQLMTILNRRIVNLEADLRHKSRKDGTRRAA
jgi:hypothetical protein